MVKLDFTHFDSWQLLLIKTDWCSIKYKAGKSSTKL